MLMSEVGDRMVGSWVGWSRGRRANPQVGIWDHILGSPSRSTTDSRLIDDAWCVEDLSGADSTLAMVVIRLVSWEASHCGGLSGSGRDRRPGLLCRGEGSIRLQTGWFRLFCTVHHDLHVAVT